MRFSVFWAVLLVSSVLFVNICPTCAYNNLDQFFGFPNHLKNLSSADEIGNFFASSGVATTVRSITLVHPINGMQFIMGDVQDVRVDFIITGAFISPDSLILEHRALQCGARGFRPLIPPCGPVCTGSFMMPVHCHGWHKIALFGPGDKFFSETISFQVVKMSGPTEESIQNTLLMREIGVLEDRIQGGIAQIAAVTKTVETMKLRLEQLREIQRNGLENAVAAASDPRYAMMMASIVATDDENSSYNNNNNNKQQAISLLPPIPSCSLKHMNNVMCIDSPCSAELSAIRNRVDIALTLNRLGLWGHGVEVGVWRGEFSESILSTWLGSRLYLIDTWDSEEVMGYGDLQQRREELEDTKRRVERFGERAVILKGDSVALADKFEDESLDFVYIDASHTYDDTRADIVAFYPKLRRGGLFAGHDFTEGYVEGAYRFGVKRAVDEFIRQHNLPPAMSTFGDGEAASWFVLKCEGFVYKQHFGEEEVVFTPKWIEEFHDSQTERGKEEKGKVNKGK